MDEDTGGERTLPAKAHNLQGMDEDTGGERTLPAKAHNLQVSLYVNRMNDDVTCSEFCIGSSTEDGPSCQLCSGPLLATDVENGYLVQWRAHERPLSMKRTRVQELQYIANKLDNIGGGDDGLVIVINCMAHFVPFPVRFYLQRIQNIHHAVVRLLERSPQTKVIIKSGNTGFLYEHGSDWLSLQLDTLMRGVFSGLPVTIIDA
ncbi:unnamed protein product [Ranitomeya imitator]|uniref:NXPE C-terminal domain-containing protein n=1 Tax=Ranitomeya imitator TaxID=111125 RepID=A0ABN9MF79_9NEOB|nr:unnamed protein product [Ranitomeya imitator]